MDKGNNGSKKKSDKVKKNSDLKIRTRNYKKINSSLKNFGKKNTDNKEKKAKADAIIKNKKKGIFKQKRKEENNKFGISEICFLSITVCVVSLLIGIVCGSKMSTDIGSDVNDEKLQKFIDEYEYIVENYYGDVDEDKLLAGALSGVLDALGDEYSYMMDESEINNFNIELEGMYDGIGVEIYNGDGGIVVSDVFEDSPAAKAGIKVGDILKTIDGVDYSGKTIDEGSSYIKNSKNSKFIIGIERDGQTFNVEVVRESITLKSVSSKIITHNNKKIGYVDIDVFSTVTADQFKDALDGLEKQGIDGLIIDIRDNTGGHLTTASDILSQLLDSSNVIYQIASKTETKKYYSKGRETKKYPIVILQNHNSASASELLSICLKEMYGATIVGENSYGKGTVQELSKEGTYKFTTKRWLSPKGKWINNVGVDPDVNVDMNQAYYDNPTEENDNQLRKALEVFDK